MAALWLALLLNSATASPLEALDPARIDGTLKVPPEVVAVLPKNPRAIAALAWAPDGRTLAVADWANTIQLWHFGQPAPRAGKTLEGGPSQLAFSPDGRLLCGGSPNTAVQRWRLQGEQVQALKPLPGHKNRPFA